jgi:hypothetical protein
MKNFFIETHTNVKKFERDAHRIFSKHETSKSRVISLEDSKQKLLNLSISQEKLLKDSIFCVECELYRPAYVMAWAALIDFYEKKISSDNLGKVHHSRNNWVKYKTVEDLRESVAEYQLIEVGREIGFLTKHEVSVLKANLTKRNNCAHPSDFSPNMNETIGYLSEIMNYIEKFDKRPL